MGFTSNRVGIIGGKKVCITGGELKGSLVWKVVKISELLKMKKQNLSSVLESQTVQVEKRV